MAGALDLIDSYAPGVIAQRETIDAVATALQAAGGVLTADQVVAALPVPLPVYPATLPRFADSNPDIRP